MEKNVKIKSNNIKFVLKVLLTILSLIIAVLLTDIYWYGIIYDNNVYKIIGLIGYAMIGAFWNRPIIKIFNYW